MTSKGVGGGAAKSLVFRGSAALQRLRIAATRQRFQLYSGTTKETKWLYINNALSALGRTSEGNTITPYYDSAEAYRQMWQAVDQAKHTVRWQTYICKHDNVGQITVDKLIAAKKRGCHVELLYDSGGNMTGRAKMMAPLKEAGVQVIEYRPFFSYIKHYFEHGMRWHLSPGIRNHRKILIVDNCIGFLGGLNIGDDYAGTEVGGNGRFRDTQCRVEGPAVQHLIEVYNDTIASSEGPSDHPRAPPNPIRSGKGTFLRWRHWAGRVARFRSKTIISPKVMPSFVPRSLRLSLRIRGRVQDQALRRVLQTRKMVARLASHTEVQRKRQQMAVIRQRWEKRFLDRIRRGKRMLVAPAHSASAPKISPQQAALERFQRMRQRGQQLRATLRANMEDRLERRRHNRRNSVLTTDEKVAREAAESGRAQVLVCGPLHRDWGIQLAFWLAVRKSHSRVWITTPYFLPNRKLMNAVVCAAERGVDVRIVIGSHHTSDPWFMWYVAQYITHRLLKAGVRIYEYDEAGRVMHAKTVVIDSTWASIGSYNWDVLSNKLLEVSIAGFDTRLAATMEQHFEKDMALSKEVQKEQFESRPWHRKLMCFFSYHLLKLSERVSFWDYKDPDLTSRLD